MSTVRITEAELARDLHAVLARVKEGQEIVVEENHRAVAVIRPSSVVGRPISEIVDDLNSRGSTAVIDDGFAPGGSRQTRLSEATLLTTSLEFRKARECQRRLSS